MAIEGSARALRHSVTGSRMTFRYGGPNCGFGVFDRTSGRSPLRRRTEQRVSRRESRHLSWDPAAPARGRDCTVAARDESNAARTIDRGRNGLMRRALVARYSSAVQRTTGFDENEIDRSHKSLVLVRNRAARLRKRRPLSTRARAARHRVGLREQAVSAAKRRDRACRSSPSGRRMRETWAAPAPSRNARGRSAPRVLPVEIGAGPRTADNALPFVKSEASVGVPVIVTWDGTLGVGARASVRRPADRGSGCARARGSLRSDANACP